MMKKLSYYAAALLLAGSLLTITSSCVDQIRVGDGFLEKAEGEDVNEDLIFSSKVYTEYLLGNVMKVCIRLSRIAIP